MFIVYNLLLILLSPLIMLYMLWRVLISGKSKKAWRQQLGMLPDSLTRYTNRPRVWLHAVSVGEAVASGSVIRELKALVPDVEIVVSTTTTTGQDMVRKALPEVDHTIYFPFDILLFVRRSLSIVKPDVFVCVESEIWPNFFHEADRLNIPTMIINGVVSDKTIKRGSCIRPLYRWALSGVEKLMMQTQTDARRIVTLGAPASRVNVTGNCKFDQELEPLSPVQAEDIRKRFHFTNGQKVFVAGSTNPGEDEAVIIAFKLARSEHPELRLVIAPRQIERAESILELSRSFGFSCGRRSMQESLIGNEDIVILDTFGELATVYSIGEVAFVGGSLIPKGGHNILQPIAQGKPVFFGPYMFKSRDLARQSKEAGVGFEINSGEELGREISFLMSDPERLKNIHEQALEMIRKNKGASKRCAQSIAEELMKCRAN